MTESTIQTVVTQTPKGVAVGLAIDDEIVGASISHHKCEGYDKWVLDKIRISEQFRGNGYGSQLLEATCKALWDIAPYPIVLHPALPGFNREPNLVEAIQKGGVQVLEKITQDLIAWYKRHGFSGSNERAAMFRYPPNHGE